MWKIWWLPFVTLLGLIRASAATPAIKPQSQRGIIFPAVDQYDECFVDAQQTQMGSCKRLEDCASALERWRNEDLRPQTCYFNKFDHIVCCALPETRTAAPEVYTPPPDVKRRSDLACELYYDTVHTTVVHGTPTKPKEFPFMAALGWVSNFDGSILYRCGGALISDRYVLTAAHCIEFGSDFPTVVRIGGVNLTDASVEDVPIKRIIVHPGYNISDSYNDIALIELEQAVGEMPACLWSQNTVAHSNVTAIGYGHTRFAGANSNQLLKASLHVVDNDKCEMYFPADPYNLQKGIASTHICAGDPEQLRDTCQGDSGGPIVMNIKRFITYPYIVGITSFGLGCAGEPPSVYTRTSSYIDWIEDIVWPIAKLDVRRSK